MLGVNQRVLDPIAYMDRIRKTLGSELRVSCPGIVVDFDPSTLTATIQPAIMEEVQTQGASDTNLIPLPQLLDVPIVFPTAGGYSVTFPIRSGDECLVVFGDQCMDSWWQSGGVQPEIDKRRHDLSDGYAIVGVRNQKRLLPNYSMEGVQVRNDQGTAYLQISGEDILIKGKTLKMEIEDTISATSQEFVKTNDLDSTITQGLSLTATAYSTMGGSGTISIGTNGNTVIEGGRYKDHAHRGVQTGPSNTGGVA